MPTSSGQPEQFDVERHCVYLNEETGNWTALDCPAIQMTSLEITCCSYHMTLFSVQDMEVSKVRLDLASSFVLPVLCAFDGLLVVGVIVGIILDRK